MGLGLAIAGFVFIGEFSDYKDQIYYRTIYPSEWLGMTIVGGILNLYNCYYYAKSKSSSDMAHYIKFALYFVCTIIGLAGEFIFILGLTYAHTKDLGDDMKDEIASILYNFRNFLQL